MKSHIPFLSLEHMTDRVRSDLLNSFESLLNSNRYILGDRLVEFEKSYADFNTTKYCIGVSSGLDALQLSLLALGIGKGDEVIIPANTFIATALSVSHCGATPILVEPNIDTYNIDSSSIRAAITNSTKAIVPVHLYGQACNMTEIQKIADEFSIDVIEDNAQAQGATWKGQLTGSFGLVNATSFYPGKNLGALGDAGAITTNSEEIYHTILELRNYGSKTKYIHKTLGFNKRLDECQASFLSIKLKHLREWNKQRNDISQSYSIQLRGVGDLKLPFVEEFATSVNHLYVVRTTYRDQLMKYLSSKGIDTLVHYPVPIFKQKCYSHLKSRTDSFMITNELASTSLSLPIYPGLTIGDVSRICEEVNNFFQ